MIALLPVLVALVGALLYALTAKPKLAELGRLAFGAGLLVALLVLAQHMVHLLPG